MMNAKFIKVKTLVIPLISLILLLGTVSGCVPSNETVKEAAGGNNLNSQVEVSDTMLNEDDNQNKDDIPAGDEVYTIDENETPVENKNDSLSIFAEASPDVDDTVEEVNNTVENPVEAVNDEPVEQVKPVDAPPKYPEDIGCYDDDEKIIFMRASGETYTVKKEKSTVVYKDDPIEIIGRQVYVDSSKTVYMNDGSFITVLNENRPVENKSNSNNSNNNSNNSNNTNTSNNSGNSNNGNGTSSGNVEIPENKVNRVQTNGTGTAGNGGKRDEHFEDE